MPPSMMATKGGADEDRAMEDRGSGGMTFLHTDVHQVHTRDGDNHRARAGIAVGPNFPGKRRAKGAEWKGAALAARGSAGWTCRHEPQVGDSSCHKDQKTVFGKNVGTVIRGLWLQAHTGSVGVCDTRVRDVACSRGRNGHTVQHCSQGNKSRAKRGATPPSARDPSASHPSRFFQSPRVCACSLYRADAGLVVISHLLCSLLTLQRV